MSLVDEAIAKAQEVLKIPGMPWAEIGDYFTGEWTWRQVLLESQQRAISAIGNTNIGLDEIDSLTEESAFKAVTDVWARLVPQMGDVLEALKGDFSAFTATLPQENLRTALVAAYAYNRIGTNLHYEGAFARAIDNGEISMDVAMAHLDRCMRIWDGIAALGERGVLDAMLPARHPEVSGLGVIQLGAGVIVLIVLLAGVAVLAVLGITLVLGLLLEQKKAQERAWAQCDMLLKEGRLQEAADCRDAALEASNENVQAGMDKIMEPLTFAAWVLGIGAVVYIGTTFVLPALRFLPKPKPAGAASA